jgi:hypothetical protein
MAILRYAAAALLALLPMSFTAAQLHASTVEITLTGVGPANDGTDFVLPYQLTINGTTQILADCYDFFDSVTIGQSWQAFVLTLPQIATTGQFRSNPNALTDYEDVAWLSAQSATTELEQVDLQHDIWNVFDPGKFSPTAGMSAYLAAMANADFSTYDFNSFTFLEGVGNTDGGTPVQAFVYLGGENELLQTVPVTPEPGSLSLMLVGCVVAAVGCRLRISSRRNKSVSSARR